MSDVGDRYPSSIPERDFLTWKEEEVQGGTLSFGTALSFMSASDG